MRIIVLLLTPILCFHLIASAQENYNSKVASLTFTTPVFANSYAVEPGIEFNLIKNWNFFSGFAVGLTKFNDRFDKIHAYRTNNELRWYYNSMSHRYLSFQLGHSFRTFYDYHQGKYFDKLYSDSAYSYSSAKIKSPVTTIALIMGRKLYTNKKFYLDAAFGAGVRFISTTYNAENVVKDQDYKPADNWNMFTPGPAYNCNCNLTRFHASVSLRAGVNL